jgi:hypothetical protein
VYGCECTHKRQKCRDGFGVTPDHPCGAGGAWESSVAAETASRIPPQGRASVSEPYLLGLRVTSKSRCPPSVAMLVKYLVLNVSVYRLGAW